jgi:hypothetical protein
MSGASALRGESVEQIEALNTWIDSWPANKIRDREALLWSRVAKVSEEAGEAIAALTGVTGQNPRKGTTHNMGDVVNELLDTAVTALLAVEHIRQDGMVMDLLRDHIEFQYKRAGLS